MTGASRAFNLIECAAKSARGEIERRHRLYRRGRARIDIAGKTVVLVDDGIATGTTVRVALQSLRLAVPGLAPAGESPFSQGGLKSEVQHQPCKVGAMTERTTPISSTSRCRTAIRTTSET